MLGVGWYGLRLAKTKSDYLVAGRRLGWFMYSGTMSAVVLGGMWSSTLTDIAQFVIKTIGILVILLPVAISSAGGFAGMSAKLDASFFSFTSIGTDTIVTYFVIYTFGLLIGQDIWQRVFT